MLKFTAAPNLPFAPADYDLRHQEALTNTLRLYFNSVSNGLLKLSGELGGQFLQFPFGAFENAGNVALAAANTPTLIPLPTTVTANGVFVVPGNGMHVNQSGVYNFQFSVQFRNTDTQAQNAYIWLRKNGADITNTASAYSVPSKHGGGDGYLVAAANFYVPMVAGDYLEMWWAADNTQVSLFALPVQTVPYARPLSPSAVGTLTFVSAQV